MSYIIGSLLTLGIILILSSENDKTNKKIELLERQIESQSQKDTSSFWDSESKRRVE